MVGSVLYPLNGLKQHAPAQYAAHAAKYAGRDYMLTRRLPKLDCLWNDVLHCAPIHPSTIRRAITEAGFSVPNSLRWFVIPVDAITHSMAIFQSDKHHTSALPDACITRVAPQSYREVTEMSASTLAWYAELKENNQPLRGFFNRAPHLLIQGAVDVSTYDIIVWND